MTKQQTATILGIISELYPRTAKNPTAFTVETWHEMLGDLDFEAARMAVKRHVALSEWPPTVADIRRSAVKATAPAMLTDCEAWGEVTAAVRLFGSYRKSEALAFMSETTRKCVMALGWREICMADLDDMNTLRAQFNRYYAVMAKRAEEQWVLPLGLTEGRQVAAPTLISTDVGTAISAGVGAAISAGVGAAISAGVGAAISTDVGAATCRPQTSPDGLVSIRNILGRITG